jgi:formylglycine-generating enzyme
MEMFMRRVRYWTSLLPLVVALACSVPVGQLWDTDAGAGVGGNTSFGGASGEVDASAQGCNGNHESIQVSTGLCVASMVPINGNIGGDSFSIDVTEVTKGQYDSWLSVNPALPTEANCSYVVSYAEQSAVGVYTGTDAAHHPVVSVDWCDAYAYCNAVGKRLCGAIGGGSTGYSSYSDVTSSQWFRACSSGNDDEYPYGNTFQGSYCNGHDYGANQTVAVGSVATCVTAAPGFAGVYDLSGNVWEWEDSCSTTGQSAACHIRGGSFSGTNSNLFCGYNVTGSRNYTNNGVGFRCCST